MKLCFADVIPYTGFIKILFFFYNVRHRSAVFPCQLDSDKGHTIYFATVHTKNLQITAIFSSLKSRGKGITHF